MDYKYQSEGGKRKNEKERKETKNGGIYTLDKGWKKLIHLQQTARRAAIH
jgi:hypothetical protein